MAWTTIMATATKATIEFQMANPFAKNPVYSVYRQDFLFRVKMKNFLEEEYFFIVSSF